MSEDYHEYGMDHLLDTDILKFAAFMKRVEDFVFTDQDRQI